MNAPYSDHLDPHHILAGWASGTARFWRARAAVWLDAAPKKDDFHGSATPENLAARWDRCRAIAAACQRRADVAERYGATPADLALIAGVAEAIAA